MKVRNRVEIMHGVNLDVLERRDPAHYGGLSLTELELRVADFGQELGLVLNFFQSNHEGEFVEQLHRLEGLADGVMLNPGAWTHYSWAIHDALEMTGLPAIEIHLSDPWSREEWRHNSVVSDLCLASVKGKGIDGYREGLELLKAELAR